MIPPNDFEGCKKSNLPSTDCFEINTSQQSISAFWDGKNVHQNKSLKTRGTTRIAFFSPVFRGKTPTHLYLTRITDLPT